MRGVSNNSPYQIGAIEPSVAMCPFRFLAAVFRAGKAVSILTAVGHVRPPSPYLTRLGLGACAELGDPIGRLQAQAGQPAEGQVEDEASPLLHLAAYLRLPRPPVSRTQRHLILAGPRVDRLAPSDHQGELALEIITDVFLHVTLLQIQGNTSTCPTN